MAAEITDIANSFNAKTEALLTEFSQTANRKYRLNRWYRPLFWIGLSYWAGYELFIKLLDLPVSAAWAAKLDLFSNVCLGIITLASLPEIILWKQIEKRKARLRLLIRALDNDPRALGPLAQLCCFAQLVSAFDLAAEPLLKLLPRLKPGDARHLSDEQMAALLSLLAVRLVDRSNEHCTALALAILKALEQIGDSRAIEPVRCLTTGSSNRRYHQAARECLAVLEQQGEARDYNRSLLSPSSLEAGKETLLRPTAHQTEMHPEMLLRASAEKELE